VAPHLVKMQQRCNTVYFNEIFMDYVVLVCELNVIKNHQRLDDKLFNITIQVQEYNKL